SGSVQATTCASGSRCVILVSIGTRLHFSGEVQSPPPGHVGGGSLVCSLVSRGQGEAEAAPNRGDTAATTKCRVSGGGSAIPGPVAPALRALASLHPHRFAATGVGST